MRATRIRYNDKNDGGKPTERMLQDLCECIVNRTAKAGFITKAHKLTGSAIKIGLHLSSFRVNTAKLGHNARVGRYVSSPKGYKRTDVPTWDQRVEFNDLINEIFNKYNLVALIKSGPFTVRDKRQGAWTEAQWSNQADGSDGTQYNGMGELCSLILPESEARERCDSDRLEAEHAEKMKPIRREQARLARERRKALMTAKQVKVKLRPYRDDKRDGVYSQKRFQNLLAKLDKYERRRMQAEPALEF